MLKCVFLVDRDELVCIGRGRKRFGKALFEEFKQF